MMHSLNLRASLLLSSALALSGFSTVQAATEPMVDEIIVTAQKRTQSASDVPISLTAYSGEKLQELGLRELDDLSNFVPGLQVQLQSPNNPGFVIRGITSDSGSAQQEARVSVFVDGVPASRARGSVVELYDIERVEVLKGPQGTLFGRGAQIGAVHIISAKPELDAMGFAGGITVGDEGQRRYEASVNVPVSDQLAIRVAGINRQRDGYIPNLAGGPDLNGVNVDAVRGSFLFKPSEEFSLTGVVNYQRDDYSGVSFKNKRFAPAGGTNSPFTAAQLNRGAELGIDRELVNATLTAEYQVNDNVTVTSITGYRDFDSLEEFDADGSQAFLLEFAEDAQGDQWSQELRINYDSGENFQGFVGVSYFYEDGFQRVPLRTNERSLALLTVPALAAAVGAPILPDGSVNPGVPALPTGLALRNLAVAEFTNFGTNRAYEAFADGTYNLTPTLSLTAGIRVTHEKQESAFIQSNDQAVSLFGNIFRNVALKEAEEDFDSAVGRLVASYKPSDDALLYASVSRGRRPAVVQVNATLSNILRAETVWSYEAGGKMSGLDGRLQIDGSVYYYDYRNFQTSSRTPDSPIAVTVDSGSASSYGFEGVVTARPTDWASLFVTYGYVHSSFDDEDSNGNAQVLAGNTFRLNPRHVVSVAANLEQPLDGLNMIAFVTPSWTWKSRIFFEETNLPEISQGAYGVASLRLGVKSDDERWTVSLFAENIFDRNYIIDAGNTGGAFGLPTFIAGTPRFLGVDVSFKY
jgi:iron complex outermembrane recepter protein